MEEFCFHHPYKGFSEALAAHPYLILGEMTKYSRTDMAGNCTEAPSGLEESNYPNSISKNYGISSSCQKIFFFLQLCIGLCITFNK